MTAPPRRVVLVGGLVALVGCAGNVTAHRADGGSGDGARDASTVADGGRVDAGGDGSTTDGVPPAADAATPDASATDAPPADGAPSADAAPFVPVGGVHTPLPIDPDVEILDGHWLLDLYRTVLGREHDAAGFRVNLRALESGTTRAGLVGAFVASAEFQGQPALADRGGFVSRLYQVLLGRSPAADEVTAQLADLRNADGTGTGRTWTEALATTYASAEYKATNCHTSYFTLGAPVSPGALLLGDLFDGRARLQTIAESEVINLTVPSALNLWDQKLPVLKDPQAERLLAFTRAYVSTSPAAFTIVLLTSSDAVTFTEVGPIVERAGNQTFYDPHLAVDHGVCPARYVIAMECLGHEGAASLCVAQSTTPGWAETWSTPFVLVDGCGGDAGGICGTPAAESASTGTTLVDGKARYVAWTQVYDGVGANDPLAHTYSQAAAVTSFTSYFGTVMGGASPISTMMAAEPQPWCTSVWDCNNRDKQDWKREGGWYYAIYNGANYYRCDGTWGVSVARSAGAVGSEYTDRLPLSRGIAAERHDTCGISYPVVNVIGGELFVYYAYYPAAGGNLTMRARLVPTP